MLRLFSPSDGAAQAAIWGPALIAVGLAILILAAWWPAAPIVSAMALLTLGATGATLARFGRSPSLRTILPFHIVVYAGLYVLFVGASQHAAATQTGGGNLWRTIDLAASVGPMAVAVWLSWKALRLMSRTG
jgi:hypothetical protein